MSDNYGFPNPQIIEIGLDPLQADRIALRIINGDYGTLNEEEAIRNEIMLLTWRRERFMPWAVLEETIKYVSSRIRFFKAAQAASNKTF